MSSIPGTVSAVLLWLLAATAVQASPQTEPQACTACQNDPATVNDVTEGHIKAVNYRVRGGPTRIDFKGTSLLLAGEGEAWIESKEGYVEISAKIEKLRPASAYGAEFLTYVLWAITPEGRAVNLGEFVLSDMHDRKSKSKIEVTTQLQTFGMIVTAEPYFAVIRPSDVVVLENAIRKDTEGTIQEVDAQFDLEKRGQYAAQAANVKGAPPSLENIPLDLAQARNAIRIATGVGAGTFAPEALTRASTLLLQAEQEHAVGSSKRMSTYAREAVQTAEDARLVSLRGLAELRYFIERQVLMEREEALKERVLEEFARLDAEAKERELKARVEIARLEAVRQRMEQEVGTERMKAETADREAELAKADAKRAAEATQTAERDKNALRANLKKQLSTVLETQDTARGLIVNLADVHFDTAQYALKNRYREILAKVAGILLTQPELTIEVEGYTDNVGSTGFNQALSERRAESVRDYFIRQGIAASRITARGLGEDQPADSNASAEGRAKNRRVDLVVSGEAIGTR